MDALDLVEAAGHARPRFDRRLDRGVGEPAARIRLEAMAAGEEIVAAADPRNRRATPDAAGERLEVTVAAFERLRVGGIARLAEDRRQHAVARGVAACSGLVMVAKLAANPEASEAAMPITFGIAFAGTFISRAQAAAAPGTPTMPVAATVEHRPILVAAHEAGGTSAPMMWADEDLGGRRVGGFGDRQDRGDQAAIDCARMKVKS